MTKKKSTISTTGCHLSKLKMNYCLWCVCAIVTCVCFFAIFYWLSMNSDSDDPSLLDEHGLNTDSAPAIYDNSSNTSVSMQATTDDPDIHSGNSSSQQSISSAVNENVRCVNCSINVSRMRRHLLEIEEVRNLVQRWVEPQQVKHPSLSIVTK